jgi:hypothetical protein
VKAAEESEQFSGIGGLDDVGVGTEVVGAVDVALFGGRTVHDGNEAFEFRTCSDILKDIEAILAWHFDVEEQEMWKGIGFPVFKRTFAKQIVYSFFAVREKAGLDWQARL